MREFYTQELEDEDRGTHRILQNMCGGVLGGRHGALVRPQPGRLDVPPRVGLAGIAVENVPAQAVEFSSDIVRNDACWGASSCGK